MILAVWLLSLPFRLLAGLGLRRSVILACLFVLAVTAYGVAQDLGLIEPPAQAAPARRPTAGQPTPSRVATADIPAGYLRLYRRAGARYRIPWSVLAAIGKVESDHGRAPLPGVRSGSNWAGACGPMQLGCVPGSKAGNVWARYGHGRPHNPAAAIPAAARYLVDHGARHQLDRAIFAYNHSWSYVTKVKQLAAATPPEGVGDGERPDRPPPGPGVGVDGPGVRGRLRTLWHRAGPQHRPGGGRADRPPDPLSGLWHPGRPPVARHDQPGNRPRAGHGPPGALQPPRLAA